MSNNYRKSVFRKKYSKKAQMRIFFCVIVLITACLISVRSIGGAIINNLETKKILKDKEIELIQAQERHKVLENDLKKLEDPEYVSQYIRDDYYFTAEGEIFFLLPEEAIEDDVSTNTN